MRLTDLPGAFFISSCLRRPYLFSRKRKDMEEKSAWTRLVHPAGATQVSPDFQSLRTRKLTLRALDYAPPVTVHQICKQLRLNDCGKNALRSKFVGQYEFAEVPKPPLAALCAVRGGGIFEENDGGDVLQGSEYSEICDVESPQALRASSPLFKGEPWVPRVSFWRSLIQNSGK